jgi:hypothetical protein
MFRILEILKELYKEYCVLPNFICWVLIPNAIVLGFWHWVWLGNENADVVNGIGTQ